MESNVLHLHFIQGHHDTALAGHQKRAMTINLLDRGHDSQAMGKNIERYVWNCDTGQWTGNSQYSVFGVFRPFPPLHTPSVDIVMYFVVGLPQCEGFDAIWEVVDRL